jgi:putative flippase GtrA
VAVEKARFRHAAQFVRFMLAGLPSFLVAFPLNFALVEYGHLPKALAYALVLLCQVTVNFFVCYYFVFDKGSPKPLLHQFGQFLVGIMAFRCADWAIYSIATTYLGVPYLLMQFCNLALSLLKFGFAKKVMGSAPAQSA